MNDLPSGDQAHVLITESTVEDAALEIGDDWGHPPAQSVWCTA